MVDCGAISWSIAALQTWCISVVTPQRQPTSTQPSYHGFSPRSFAILSFESHIFPQFQRCQIITSRLILHCTEREGLFRIHVAVQVFHVNDEVGSGISATGAQISGRVLIVCAADDAVAFVVKIASGSGAVVVPVVVHVRGRLMEHEGSAKRLKSAAHVQRSAPR